MCIALGNNFEPSATKWRFIIFDFVSLLAIIFHFTYLYQPFAERQQKCCWILLLPSIQHWFLLTLSKFTFFKLTVLIPLVFYLIHSVLEKRSRNCISHVRFRCSFFWPSVNQYMVHRFDSISIEQFPPMVCYSLSTSRSISAYCTWFLALLPSSYTVLFRTFLCFWVRFTVPFTSAFSLRCTEMCKVSTKDSHHGISWIVVLISDIEGHCLYIFNNVFTWLRSDLFSVSL